MIHEYNFLSHSWILICLWLGPWSLLWGRGPWHQSRQWRAKGWHCRLGTISFIVDISVWNAAQPWGPHRLEMETWGRKPMPLGRRPEHSGCFRGSTCVHGQDGILYSSSGVRSPTSHPCPCQGGTLPKLIVVSIEKGKGRGGALSLKWEAFYVPTRTHESAFGLFNDSCLCSLLWTHSPRAAMSALSNANGHWLGLRASFGCHLINSKLFSSFLIYLLTLRERERKAERWRETSICYSIYWRKHWFLYVPWPGIEPTTLVYWVDALTELPSQGCALISWDVGSNISILQVTKEFKARVLPTLQDTWMYTQLSLRVYAAPDWS